MKPIILCIIGESGSGKTHMTNYIQKKYNMKMIESHTDRPRRSKDEVGHTFHTPKEYDKLDLNNVLASTVFGTNRYCCLKSDLEEKNTYVIDENGYNQITEKFANDYDIYSVRITKPNIDVGSERTERDVGKFIYPIEYFDYHINNDNTIEAFETKIDKIINKIF